MGVTMAERCNRVVVGDVICLNGNDCKLLGDISVGEYVVEDTRDSGGWQVSARKLDKDGKYCADGPIVKFHQCPGYEHSLLSVDVVRQMRRIFV